MRRSLTGLVALLFAVLSAGGLFAVDEISGELVGLNVSLAAEKQLVVHDQLVAAEEWAPALDLLDRLAVDHGDVLVKAAPGRYVGLSVAIQQRLTRLPAAGLDVYRRRHNPSATAMLTRAQREGDTAALWRIVEESASTPAAQFALRDLATQAATRGDLELALRLWGRLRGVPSKEERVFPPPIVSLLLADAEQSRRTTILMAVARHAVGVPLSSGELAAVGGDLAVNEKPANEKPADELFHHLVATPRSPFRSTAPLGSIGWSTLATPNCPLPEYQAPLSVTSGRAGLLLVSNGQTVRALHEESGEPFWPTGFPHDVGVLFEDSLPDSEPNHEHPCRIASGVCTADRYFGVIGDAPRWRPRPGLVPLSGSLVALDLAAGQGRILWQVESRDLPEPEWLLHGGPTLSRGDLPGDDLVVVPLCRPAPQVELAVAAFSQDDGHLVWWTRIGTSTAAAGQPLPNTHLLTQAGLVVARTLTGVILALDARSGRIQWASTAMVSSPPTQSGSHASLIDGRAGVLVASDPSDSQEVPSRVAGFSLDSGEELWKQELPFPVQGVVCAEQGKVLIAGSRLRAVSLLSGTPLWEQGVDDPAGAGTGTPFVDAGTVLWPTRVGIKGLDLVTGAMEFERRITVESVADPIQLLRTNSHWMISRPNAILCLQKDGVSKP